VYSVLKSAAPELLYESENSYIVVDNRQIMYEPVLDKKCDVHLLIPCISSSLALTRINEFEITSGFNIIMYVSKIVKTYGNILDGPTLKKISELYKKIFQYVNFADLTPIYFQHKIADSISTIDLILIKGQVLDDQTKKLVFIKECEYDKYDPKKARYDPKKARYDPKQDGFVYNKIYCPIPPYLEFEKYLLA
jgi:hypothetical protein